MEIGRLKEIGARYMALSLPMKIAVGATLSAVTSIGVGVLAEYAAYTYALYWDVRPPVEGIPFLQATVSAIVITMIAGAIIISLLTYAALSFIHRRSLPAQDSTAAASSHTEGTSTDLGAYGRIKNVLSNTLRQWWSSVPRPFRLAVVYSLTAIVLLLGLFALVEGFREAFRDIAAGDPFPYYPAATIMAWVVASALMLRWPQFRYWFSGFLAFAFFVGVPAFLFHPQFYGQLLRTLNYGGGIPITISYSTQDAESGVQKGRLVFRTSEAMVLLDPSAGQVSEIPLERVIRVDYSPTETSKIIEKWANPSVSAIHVISTEFNRHDLVSARLFKKIHSSRELELKLASVEDDCFSELVKSVSLYGSVREHEGNFPEELAEHLDRYWFLTTVRSPIQDVCFQMEEFSSFEELVDATAEMSDDLANFEATRIELRERIKAEFQKSPGAFTEPDGYSGH